MSSFAFVIRAFMGKVSTLVWKLRTRVEALITPDFADVWSELLHVHSLAFHKLKT